MLQTILGIVFGLLLGLGAINYLMTRMVIDPIEGEAKRKRAEKEEAERARKAKQDGG